MDLQQLKSEMTEMTAELTRKIEKSEELIKDHITFTLRGITTDGQTQTEKLEANMKEHFKNIMSECISKLNTAIKPHNEPSVITPGVPSTANNPDHKEAGPKDGGMNTTAVPEGLEPAAKPKHPIHDVYIGGTSPTTTEDDVRDYLVKIGVTQTSILTIECVSGSDPVSSSFRVRICDTSIKDTVYNRANYKPGIIIKPFRYYNNDISRSANMSGPSDEVKHQLLAAPRDDRVRRNNTTGNGRQPAQSVSRAVNDEQKREPPRYNQNTHRRDNNYNTGSAHNRYGGIPRFNAGDSQHGKLPSYNRDTNDNAIPNAVNNDLNQYATCPTSYLNPYAASYVHEFPTSRYSHPWPNNVVLNNNVPTSSYGSNIYPVGQQQPVPNNMNQFHFANRMNNCY